MSTSFELVKRDKDGNPQRRIKFALCEDCADELLQDLNAKVEFN